MKRLALILIVLFTAATLFAGGKECNLETGAKSVELTGTIAKTGSGDDVKSVFRVANSNQSYTICHKSKAATANLGNDSATYRVKGKVVSCDEGKALMIDEAQKI